MGAKDGLGINLAEGSQLDHNTPEKIRRRSRLQSLFFASFPLVTPLVFSFFAEPEASMDFSERVKIAMNVPLVFMASELIGHRRDLLTITGIAVGIGGAYMLRENFPISQSPVTTISLISAMFAGLADSYGTGSFVIKLLGGKAIEASTDKVGGYINDKLNERREN